MPGQHYMVPRRCQTVLEDITRHRMALDGAWYHCWGAVAGAGVRVRWCDGVGAAAKWKGSPRLRFPIPLSPPLEHKNPDFVLETPENRGSRPQKRTKTSILCSKCPKTRVSKAKKAQKPRFCARNARKRGFRRAKAHKNADFVLEMSENKGSKPQKRTKIPILCSGRGGLAPGRDEISFGKHNNGLPANHRAHHQNINT